MTSGAAASVVRTPRPRLVRRRRGAAGRASLRAALRCAAPKVPSTVAVLTIVLQRFSYPALGREGRIRSVWVSVCHAASEGLYRTYFRIALEIKPIFESATDIRRNTLEQVFVFGLQCGYSFESSHRHSIETGQPWSSKSTVPTRMRAEDVQPRTRRRTSLSDKQLAILDVIQRSVASPRLPAEHARDRRCRRPLLALERHPPARPARALGLPPPRPQPPARHGGADRPPGDRAVTRRRARIRERHANRRRRDGAARRAASPPASRSPPTSRSKRSTRSPASSPAGAPASCSCSRSSASR